MPNRYTPVPDPATWPETCELGCHEKFERMRINSGPEGTHRRLGIPICGMARAMRNAYDRDKRGLGLLEDVEPWARAPWEIEALVLKPNTESFVDDRP